MRKERGGKGSIRGKRGEGVERRMGGGREGEKKKREGE